VNSFFIRGKNNAINIIYMKGWLSGRALELRFTGRGFNPGRFSLSRNIGQLSLASLQGL